MSGTSVGGQNPLISQGTVNRLRASLTFPSNTQLNVGAQYLGREGIRMTLEGEATLMIQTLTGVVISPEPYQMTTIRAALLFTQSLAQAYKTQMETNTAIGTCTVKPAASQLATYSILNCAIRSIEGLDFSGENASFIVTISGYYNLNSDLWNVA
jgi:hypothetical protein